MNPSDEIETVPDTAPETARAIAEAVRSGQIPPAAAVERSLRRIRERDPGIRAFLVVREAEALAEAEALSRRADLDALPLAGVPIAVKDNLDVAGLPTTGGSAAVPATPAPVDADVVARLRAAGAVVVGKTTLPEMAIWATTDGFWGETRNPHRPDRTPGGSSGGSAAAVAAGMVPLAVGNDGLGSIRIPAACCGIAGFKPPNGGGAVHMAGGDWYGMAANGPLARAVDDVALAAAIMAGAGAEFDGGAWPNRPERLDGPDHPERPLRLAVSTRTPLPGGRVDPEWVEAAHQAAERLRARGHRMIEVEPPYSPLDALPVFARWFAGVADAIDALCPDTSSRLEGRTRVHARLGRWVRRLGGPRERARRRVQRRLRGFLDRYDALVTPALAMPPIPARRWSRRSWLANISANARYAPFAAGWNLVDVPAGVVPVGVHSDGTPLAVQVVAGLERGASVLRVMLEVEEVFAED